MYSIRIDHDTGIIEIDINGFWSVDQVETFAADLKRSVAAVLATGKTHRVLYDYSASSIQPQDVIGALQTLALTVEKPALRIALFTQGRLARLQAGRIAAVRDDIRLFEDRAAALAWLRDAPPGVGVDAGGITAPVARPASSPTTATSWSAGSLV